ncbi:hypothetical protein VPH35_134179 [Triticum aestivum]
MPGVCHRRRRNPAYAAWVVTEHGATGVSAPGRVCGGATGVDASSRVRGLGHGRDDDNNMSCNNSGDGKSRLGETVTHNLDMHKFVSRAMHDCWLVAWSSRVWLLESFQYKIRSVISASRLLREVSAWWLLPCM